MKKNIISKVLFGLFCLNLVSPSACKAYDANSLLKKLDQPFCFFKTGGKDPYVIKYNPATNQLSSIVCGYYDKNKDYLFHIKKPQDMENLVVLRSISFMADISKKVDQKYRGYRETVVGVYLEELLKTIRILPEREYNGTILIDEYVEGIPLKLVLKNKQDLQSITAYYKKHFKEKKISPLSKKPLLVIEFIKHDEKINPEDLEFFDKHFEISDTSDETVANLFERFQSSFFRVLDATKGAQNAAETFGEMAMRLIEKYCHDFKVKDLMALATLTFSAVLTWNILYDCFIKTIKEKAEEAIKKHIPILKRKRA